MGLVICLAGGKRKIALVFSPAIFIFFGFLFIGRILHPEFPPNHVIHYAGDRKLNIEGLLYRPPEPLEDKVRIFLKAEKIHLEEGAFPVVGNLLLTINPNS